MQYFVIQFSKNIYGQIIGAKKMYDHHCRSHKININYDLEH